MPVNGQEKAPAARTGKCFADRGSNNEPMHSRTERQASQALPRSRDAARFEILELMAEPGREVMRELPSGAWVDVRGTGRDRYVTLDKWRGKHRKVKLHGKHRVHVRPRHELVPLDYDERDRAPLDAAFAELEGLGYAWIGWVSSLRGGYPHYHGLVAVESLERRLLAEHIIEKRLDKAVLKPEGLSCPGFAGKVVEDGVNYYPSEECEVCGERGVQGECDACGHITWNETTRYDTSMRDWMWERQDNNLEFLHDVLAFLRAVPRWEIAAGMNPPWNCWTWSMWQSHSVGTTPIGPPPPAPPPTPAVPSSPPVIEPRAATTWPDWFIELVDREVEVGDEQQAYDSYEPTEASRHAYHVMKAAQHLGITHEALWAEHARAGMAHFRSERQLMREWNKVLRDGSVYKRGDRRLAHALIAQDDPLLTELEKRLILHVAIRKDLKFGYRNLGDEVGCSWKTIERMVHRERVKRYLRKSGPIIRPHTGRVAQTFEILPAPKSVDAARVTHSGDLRGVVEEIMVLRRAKLRWWEMLPSGDTVLDALRRLGSVEKMIAEMPAVMLNLLKAWQMRTNRRQRDQERYYAWLDEQRKSREKRQEEARRARLDAEIAFYRGAA